MGKKKDLSPIVETQEVFTLTEYFTWKSISLKCVFRQKKKKIQKQPEYPSAGRRLVKLIMIWPYTDTLECCRAMGKEMHSYAPTVQDRNVFSNFFLNTHRGIYVELGQQSCPK